MTKRYVASLIKKYRLAPVCPRVCPWAHFCRTLAVAVALIFFFEDFVLLFCRFRKEMFKPFLFFFFAAVWAWVERFWAPTSPPRTLLSLARSGGGPPGGMAGGTVGYGIIHAPSLGASLCVALIILFSTLLLPVSRLGPPSPQSPLETGLRRGSG